ncbi:MAG: hypothetical protein ABI778_04460 [Ignavibacteriota bacterium]
MKNVTLVKWQQFLDFFRCTVADAMHRVHTVEIPKTILNFVPRDFKRGSDEEHVGIIAAGAVLLSSDTEERFHKMDGSKVDLAYNAASKAQVLGRYEEKDLDQPKI